MVCVFVILFIIVCTHTAMNTRAIKNAFVK